MVTWPTRPFFSTGLRWGLHHLPWQVHRRSSGHRCGSQGKHQSIGQHFYVLRYMVTHITHTGIYIYILIYIYIWYILWYMIYDIYIVYYDIKSIDDMLYIRWYIYIVYTHVSFLKRDQDGETLLIEVINPGLVQVPGSGGSAPGRSTEIQTLIWVNYNDLTATSLEIMVSKGNHPQHTLISGWWNIRIYPDYWKPWILCQWIGLVGKIYRKTPIAKMGKSMVSCRFFPLNQSIEQGILHFLLWLLYLLIFIVWFIE